VPEHADFSILPTWFIRVCVFDMILTGSGDEISEEPSVRDFYNEDQVFTAR
jgi:hypothetical protein